MKTKRSRATQVAALPSTAEHPPSGELRAKSAGNAVGILAEPDLPPTESQAAADAAPSSAAPVADAVKSPLQVCLSESAHEKLAFHTRNGQWTVDLIIEQLIRDGLHKAYPAISYRGVEIAEAGLFRAFDRKTRRPAVVLKSTLGEFRINPREENAEYRRWIGIYQKRGLPDFQEKAAEMCLFLLKQELEEIRTEGFKHIIYPEDFLVERFV